MIFCRYGRGYQVVSARKRARGRRRRGGGGGGRNRLRCIRVSGNSAGDGDYEPQKGDLGEHAGFLHSGAPFSTLLVDLYGRGGIKRAVFCELKAWRQPYQHGTGSGVDKD